METTIKTASITAKDLTGNTHQLKGKIKKARNVIFIIDSPIGFGSIKISKEELLEAVYLNRHDTLVFSDDRFGKFPNRKAAIKCKRIKN